MLFISHLASSPLYIFLGCYQNICSILTQDDEQAGSNQGNGHCITAKKRL